MPFIHTSQHDICCPFFLRNSLCYTKHFKFNDINFICNKELQIFKFYMFCAIQFTVKEYLKDVSFHLSWHMIQ